MFADQRKVQQFIGLVKFVPSVRSGKQYLSYDGIRAFCMGKHRTLETLQWEE
jgi:hypothetical protein